MQLLKDNTESLRRAIEKTGLHMLFRRAIMFETPSRGLVEYAPGDSIDLTAADLGSLPTCREIARLCAYDELRGIEMARAQLFKDAGAAETTRVQILERQAEAEERHTADAEASRGFATVVRGAPTGREADELAQENEALRRELKLVGDDNANMGARLAAIEKHLAGGGGNGEIPADTDTPLDAGGDGGRDPDATQTKPKGRAARAAAAAAKALKGGGGA